MSADAGISAPNESRWPALRRSLLALWLPAALPFVLGPLTECSHCVRTYLLLLPVEPGALAGALSGAQGAGFVAVSAAVTLVLVAVVFAAMRGAAGRWRWVAGSVAVLAGGQALAFAAALRT